MAFILSASIYNFYMLIVEKDNLIIPFTEQNCKGNSVGFLYFF